jgi:hypothetical protein
VKTGQRPTVKMASKDARKVANGTGRVRRSLPATPVLSSDSGSRSRESLGVTSNPHSAARAGLLGMMSRMFGSQSATPAHGTPSALPRRSTRLAEKYGERPGTSRPAGVREEVRGEDDREVEVDPPAGEGGESTDAGSSISSDEEKGDQSVADADGGPTDVDSSVATTGGARNIAGTAKTVPKTIGIPRGTTSLKKAVSGNAATRGDQRKGTTSFTGVPNGASPALPTTTAMKQRVTLAQMGTQATQPRRAPSQGTQGPQATSSVSNHPAQRMTPMPAKADSNTEKEAMEIQFEAIRQVNLALLAEVKALRAGQPGGLSTAELQQHDADLAEMDGDDADSHVSSVSQRRTSSWIGEQKTSGQCSQVAAAGKSDRSGPTTSGVGSSVPAGPAKLKSERRVKVTDAPSQASNISGTTAATSPPVASVIRSGHEKMPTYNGDSHLDAFLFQFECAAEVNGYPRTSWGMRLISALEGRARALLTIEQFGKKPLYEEVREKLRRNFGPEISATAWMNELIGLERSGEEPLMMLYVRVKELMMKAYPEVDSVARSRMAVPHFVRALGDERQQGHIWAAVPDSLERALEVALACENGRRVTPGPAPAKGRSAPSRVNRLLTEEYDEEGRAVSETALEVRALRAELGRMQTQFGGNRGEPVRAAQQGGPGGENRKCMNCSQRGHLSRDCRQPDTAATKEWKARQECRKCHTVGHIARDCTQGRGRSDFGNGREPCPPALGPNAQ